MGKKVSIIVPNFNNAPYIKMCIDSLKRQSYDNFEIIIVDDGSSDSSLEICHAYESDKIRVFSKKNEGPALARNFGLGQCDKESEYVCFVDSDDTVDIHYIRELIAYASNNTLAICGIKTHSKYTRPEPQKELTQRTDTYINFWDNKHFLEHLKNGLINSSCNKCYSLKTIRENGLKFGSAYPEDTLFNLEYLKYCDKVCYIHDQLYNYIKRCDSVTSKPYKSLYTNYMQIQRNLLDMIKPENHSFVYEFVYPQYLGNSLKFIKNNDFTTPKQYCRNKLIKDAIKNHKSTTRGDFFIKYLFLFGCYKLLGKI